MKALFSAFILPKMFAFLKHCAYIYFQQSHENRKGKVIMEVRVEHDSAVTLGELNRFYAAQGLTLRSTPDGQLRAIKPRQRKFSTGRVHASS